MLNVLFISDGIHIDAGAFEFVKEMNQKTPVLLHGFFLPKRSRGYWLLRAGSFFLLPPYKFQAQEQLIKTACSFSHLCREHHIEHSSYFGRGEAPVSKLEKESRYADLLVVSYAIFQQKNAPYRWRYLTKILRNCECPVIVVPGQFQFPCSNVIAFDGSASSVYALKQFSYLLPDLVANATVLVNVGAANRKSEGLNRSKLHILAMNHYPLLNPACLKLNSGAELTKWMTDQSAILVAGACGRSWVSQLVKRSFVAEILKDKRVPLFVAHRKR